mmetsp:Transcript_13367/g.39797  ORF Transcript_13367/g.39797 Transcript_13367/m.39797 type:complete len:155 (+) Transcript_13367:162-626(+)|eukprot:CAMPEP_0119268046 /NCGR_PEP_ID=MMETSP1329-20130426/5966_1 /TAXON_ID=114041 /ORGANISM="Genus nov. species nov., Strain RCC1024" /LENGTH=154 /DNA_ID=CAMNT_0007267997 /DNA_START=151 /DNA_END=615 /DNA_ORIENTATION=-
MHLSAVAAILAANAAAFRAPQQRVARSSVRVNGMFDFILDGFKNQEFDDRRAKARHILVATEPECAEIKAKIDGGLAFAEAASQFSSCPSAKSGGSLGSFEPGKMVREFDDVCFNPETPLNVPVGPVKTQFGYHLILLEDRFINQDRSEGSPAF